MPWNCWVINKFGGDNPPKKWEIILIELRKYLSSKYINKIEVAAFTIRSSRKLRWVIPSNHSEYATKKDSLSAAIKLTNLLLCSKGAPPVNSKLKKLLRLKKNITKCPLCIKHISLIDYDKDGRKEPDSIQMGHKIPLSRKKKSHNGTNVFWAHRFCNFLQGDRTVKEVFIHMSKVLKANGYIVTKRKSI